MIKKILLLSIFILSVYSMKPSKHQELKRQYNDFLDIFNKKETDENNFDIFIRNLNMIEEYNNINKENCKMYLTQHSDTLENEFVHIKCKK